MFDLKLDAKTFEPVAIIGVSGVIAYFLWQKLQQGGGGGGISAVDASQNSYLADQNAMMQDAETLALVQALTGNTSGTTTQTSQPATVTYTAPQTTAAAGTQSSALNTGTVTQPTV